VQKELKLTEEQVGKVKEAVQQVMGKHSDSFAKLRDLSNEERREKGAEITRVISDDTLKAVGEVLKPEQVKRLKQIDLQNDGERAFARPEVQKALNLNDEQKEKIKTISEDASKERRSVFQGGNFQEARGKLAALRKESMERIQSVLTAAQKTTWKELTGEPFEVQFQFRRPGGNG
jgi:hypothetical protein